MTETLSYIKEVSRMPDCIIMRRGSRQTVTYYIWNRYSVATQTTYYWNKYNRVTSYRYYWDRYNVVETTTYTWNRYYVVTDEQYVWAVYECITLNKPSYVESSINTSISLDQDEYVYKISNPENVNSGYWIGTSTPPDNCQYSWIGMSKNSTLIYYITTVTYVSNPSYPDLSLTVTKTRSIRNSGESGPGDFLYNVYGDYIWSYPTGSSGDGKLWYESLGSQTIYSQGSAAGTVTSTSSSAYPNDGKSGIYWYVYSGSNTTYNQGSTSYSQVSSTSSSAYPNDGKSGNYWYVYDRRTTEYSKGSTSYGKVSSTDRSAYPDNNYSGSYWYVYSTSSTSNVQGSYIDQVISTERNTYPDNGTYGSYWYVYQGTSQDIISYQASMNSILSQ